MAKKDFAGVNIEMKIILDNLCGPIAIPNVLIRRRQEGQCRGRRQSNGDRGWSDAL
jgi:hypothetical protein